jgi:uncharacterized protein YbjT (DUF2867 family)
VPVPHELGRGGGLGALASLDLRGRCASRNFDLERRCHRRADRQRREAFVDAEDIAAVAAATLADPEAHAGAEYAPTGPDMLTVREAADIIGSVIGRPVRHVDVDRRFWIDGVIASGVPAEYGQTLQVITETVASGRGSRPNDDVERVTGAPPNNFTDFARRTAAAWRGNVGP